MLPPEVSNTGHVNNESILSNGSGPGSIVIEAKGSETLLRETTAPTEPEWPSPQSGRDPYRGVAMVLLVAALVAMIGTPEAGCSSGIPYLSTSV
jgi:hypothetical protein